MKAALISAVGLMLLGMPASARASSAPLTQESTELRLASIFGDHMVLQREDRAPIWGYATPGAKVAVTGRWGARKPVSTTADAQGRWRVELPTTTAGGPYTLVATATAGATSATTELADILMGEVWICSGQSNMEWPMSATKDSAEQIAAAQHPTIRLFNVANKISSTPLESCGGSWQLCTPDSVKQFSAVGYFFGLKLNAELDVPIGLIAPNWGGTVAESWTSRDSLESIPDFRSGLAIVKQHRENLELLATERAAADDRWFQTFDEQDAGSGEGGWHAAGFDDSAWEEVQIPGSWQGDLARFDGVVWARRHFDLPANWSAADVLLELGPIDDMDSTWINGRRVGRTEQPGNHGTPRKYEIPAGLLQPGKNTLAVRVLDTGGPGGFMGEGQSMKLSAKIGAAAATRPLAGKWRIHIGVAMSELPPRPSASALHANQPTALFNGMIAPIVPFAIRGAIWYQGESNRSRAHQYGTLFPTMIRDWRKHFERPDFPFYYVQIAPYNYGGDRGEAAELREAQLRTLALKNTGMAVTMDIGNPRDIHPRAKVPVGTRLALWALAKDYGQDSLTYSGPLPRGMQIQGAKIELRFLHGAGLKTRDGKAPSHFTIAGADRKFVPATAVIQGTTVVVSSPNVAEPVAVRYGWGTADEPNLCNAADLPATSFRTDDWPWITEIH